MAEEQTDILRAENEDLKIKLEEIETDLALLREEAEIANEDTSGAEDGSVAKMQLKIKDEEIKRLKDALVKLRDLNTEEKSAAQRAIKQSKADSEELQHKSRVVSKLEEQNKGTLSKSKNLK